MAERYELRRPSAQAVFEEGVDPRDRVYADGGEQVEADEPYDDTAVSQYVQDVFSQAGQPVEDMEEGPDDGRRTLKDVSHSRRGAPMSPL